MYVIYVNYILSRKYVKDKHLSEINSFLCLIITKNKYFLLYKFDLKVNKIKTL